MSADTDLKTVYGIDLGTTYSCIAHVDSATTRAEIIRNKDNESVTPSVVLFDPPDEIIVGKIAKAEAVLHADRVAQLFKRQMRNPEWRFTVPADAGWEEQAEWSAPALSSRVLKKLAADVEEMTGNSVEDVVITVPAYFGQVEREATKQAGALAGLNVLGVINEPTAAAFSYGLGMAEGDAEETVLVYDLGGGTFDVTVISLSASSVQVVATDGDHELGGINFDERVQTFLASEFHEQNPDSGDPLDDPDTEQELANLAEVTKQQLTERGRAKALVQHGGAKSAIELSREKFDEIIADLVDRTIGMTRAALDAAKEKGGPEVSKILLVGGSSKMPVIAETLGREFGLPVELSDPDLAVAKGAALYGQKRSFDEFIGEAEDADRDQKIKEIAIATGLAVGDVQTRADREVTNVCSQGFGLGVLDGSAMVVDFLVHRNDRVPVEIERTYSTVTDNQESVSIPIYEQLGKEENTDPEKNKELMNPAIEGIPPGSPSGTEIAVRFRMGDEGTLSLEARHANHNQALNVELNVAGAISEEELEAQATILNAVQMKS